MHVAYDEPFVSSIDIYHASESSEDGLQSFIRHKGDGMCLYRCRVTTSTARAAFMILHGKTPEMFLFLACLLGVLRACYTIIFAHVLFKFWDLRFAPGGFSFLISRLLLRRDCQH